MQRTFTNMTGTTNMGTMGTTTGDTSSSRNRSLVPEARGALRNFRDQVASEFGLDFTGYNGDKTARECGSVGGEMVKRMIEQVERGMTTGRLQ